MSDVVIDVEAVGPAWSELDEPIRKYLSKRAADQLRRDGAEFADETEAEEKAADRLGLELGLARPIAIGIHMVAKQRSLILLEDTGDEKVFVREGTTVERGSETILLERFWETISDKHVGRIVTFNGRSYDGPLLMTRSAQLGVTVRRNLVPYRYDMAQHCDLADALCQQGATRAYYTLDYWCRVFGIASPKSGGVDGSQVEKLYREGRMQKIATYLDDDLRQTAELYVKLAGCGFLKQFKGGPLAHQYSQQLMALAG